MATVSIFSFNPSFQNINKTFACHPCSLTVRNQEEERARRTSHELQAEGIPNCEERYGFYRVLCCTRNETKIQILLNNENQLSDICK